MSIEDLAKKMFTHVTTWDWAYADEDDAKHYIRLATIAHRDLCGWRPISEAPRDALEVIVFGPWEAEVNGSLGESAGVARFELGAWRVTLEDAYSVTYEPTHFRKLPEPLTEGEG